MPNDSLEVQKKIQETDIRPGQSPEVRKQTDELLKVHEKIIEAEINADYAKADTLYHTEKGKKIVNNDIINSHTDQETEQLKADIIDRKPNFFEKIGEKPYRWLKIDNVSETQKTLTGVAISAGVVGAGIRGIRKLWNSLRGKNKEKKEYKESILKDMGSGIYGLIKKVLLYGGVALAGSYLASFLMKGKSLSELWDDFSLRLKEKLNIEVTDKKTGVAPGTGAGSENAVERSEKYLNKEKPLIQAKYDEIGQEINNFYSTAKIDHALQLGNETLQNLDQKVGTVPYMLDGRYNTIGDFLSGKGILDSLLSKGIGAITDRFQKTFMDTPVEVVRSFLLSFAGTLSKATFNLINTENTVEGIFKHLLSDPNYTTIVSYAFDKTMMTMSYLQNRKDALRIYLESQGLSGDKLDQEIKKICDNQKMYIFATDGTVIGGFIDYLSNNHLLTVQDSDIHEDIKEKISNSDKEKGEILENIDVLEEHKMNNTLTELEVHTLCDNLIQETNYFVDENIAYSVLPMISGASNSTIELQKTLYENSSLKLYADQFAKDLKAIRDKGTNITTHDIIELKKMTEEFYELKQQFYMSEWYVEEVQDENRNRVLDISLRVKGAFRTTKDTALYSYRLLTDSKSSLLQRATGTRYATGIVYTGYKFRGMISLNPRKIVTGFGKGFINMAMDSIKLSNIAKNKIGYASKSYLPNILASGYYNTQNKAVLFKDILTGKLSSTKAVEIANRIEGLGKERPFSSLESLLKHQFEHANVSDAQVSCLTKNIELIQRNPNLRNELFNESKWLGDWKRFYNPTERKCFNADMSHLVPNIEAIKKFEDLTNSLTKSDQSIQTVTNSMLRSSRSLDQISDIFIMLDSKRVQSLVSQSNLTLDEIGTLLGKYSKVLQKEQDFKKFFSLLEQGVSSQKITNPKIFAKNILTKWSYYASKDINTILGLTDDINRLNKPRGIAKALDSLKDLKTKLTPYRLRSREIATALDGIQDTSQMLDNPELMNALDNGISTEKTITQMALGLSTESRVAIKSLETVIKSDKVFSKALSKASSIDEVKALLKEKNITGIADDIVKEISLTKSGKIVGNRVLDKVHYLANAEEVGKVMKFLNNPTTRVVGRVLGKVLVVGGVGLGLYQWINSGTEAAKVEGENKQMADVIRQEGLVDGLGFGVAGSLLGSGLLLSRTPAGWVLLAAGGVLLAGQQIYDSFVASEKAWARNKSNFLKAGQGIVDNFILENLFHPSSSIIGINERLKKANANDIDIQSTGQISDGIDAKIILNLHKLYPMATINVDAGENDETIATIAKQQHITPSAVSNAIIEQKKVVSTLYHDAKSYITQLAGTAEGISNAGKNEVGTSKSYLLIKKLVGNETNPTKAMDIINTNVGRSILFAQNKYNATQTDIQTVLPDYNTKESLQTLLQSKSSLESEQKDLFRKMEALYIDSPYQYLVIANKIHLALEYRQEDTKEYMKLERLRKYLIRKQAQTGISIDMMMANYNYNSGEISQMPFDVERFLITRNQTPLNRITDKEFLDAEVEARAQVCKTDTDIETNYHIGRNPIDTIMYRYATEVLGQRIDFSKESFDNIYNEGHKQYNGIYRDEGKRRINYDERGFLTDNSENMLAATINPLAILGDWTNPFDNDKNIEGKNNIHAIQDMIAYLNRYQKQIFNSDKNGVFNIGDGVDEHYVEQYKTQALIRIAQQELRYLQNKSFILKQTIDYLTAQKLKSNEYIPLPIDMIIKLSRAGIRGIAGSVYSIQGSILYLMDRQGNKKTYNLSTLFAKNT